MPPKPKDDRSHFLAHMGHDLRAPLTNILALSEALKDGVYGPTNPQQAETLGHIRDNGNRMLRMITDLVDLARFETGELSLDRVMSEVVSPCREGVQVVHGHAKSKNISLEFQSSVEGIQAIADARRLRQLSTGLAGAAVVSAPANGLVVFAMEALPAEGKMIFKASVSRTTPGTYPSDNSTPAPLSSSAALQRLRKMSSVSVTLVEKIVALHHGTLDVTDLGPGQLVITAMLPLAFSETIQPTPQPASGISDSPPESMDIASPLILLADDEQIIRSITQDYLESIGYRVICATNGREAIDLLQSQVPDLIIMDMQMPVLDGLEAMQQIRKSGNPQVAAIPIISLSGLATPGHRERCIAAGANRCLAKPFGIKDLELAITETLRR